MMTPDERRQRLYEFTLRGSLIVLDEFLEHLFPDFLPDNRKAVAQLMERAELAFLSDDDEIAMVLFAPLNYEGRSVVTPRLALDPSTITTRVLPWFEGRMPHLLGAEPPKAIGPEGHDDLRIAIFAELMRQHSEWFVTDESRELISHESKETVWGALNELTPKGNEGLFWEKQTFKNYAREHGKLADLLGFTAIIWKRNKQIYKA